MKSDLIETLQRRIAYGGRKGRRARIRLRRIDRRGRYSVDQATCRRFYEENHRQ